MEAILRVILIAIDSTSIVKCKVIYPAAKGCMIPPSRAPPISLLPPNPRCRGGILGDTDPMGALVRRC